MERMLLAVLAASLVLPASAQIHPDMSGTWALDPARSESPVEGDAAGPTTLVIAQSDAEVIVEARRSTRTDVTAFPFDAKRAPSSVRKGVEGARSWWTGTKLATEATYLVHDQAVTARQTFTLNAAGTELTVETVVEVQHGYDLKGGRNYATSTDVFKKVP